MVEAAEFFPLDDSKSSVQGVQLRNLNVTCVLIVAVVVRKSYPFPRSLAVLWRARRHPESAAERTILLIDAHSHIDERNAELLKLGDKHLLVRTLIDADEREIHPARFLDVSLGQKSIMNDDAAVHLLINAFQVRHFRRLRLQLRQ